MATTLKFGKMSVDDVDFFTLDFADGAAMNGPALDPGDTIVSQAVTTGVLKAPSGVTPAAIRVVATTITGTADAPLTRLSVRLDATGATAGVTYLVEAEIVSADGRTLNRSVQIPMEVL